MISNGKKDLETINAYVYTYDYGKGKTVLRLSVLLEEDNTFDSILSFLKDSNGNFTIDEEIKLEGFNTDIRLTSYQNDSKIAEFEVTKESEETRKMNDLQTQLNSANLAIAELYESNLKVT